MGVHFLMSWASMCVCSLSIAGESKTLAWLSFSAKRQRQKERTYPPVHRHADPSQPLTHPSACSPSLLIGKCTSTGVAASGGGAGPLSCGSCLITISSLTHSLVPSCVGSTTSGSIALVLVSLAMKSPPVWLSLGSNRAVQCLPSDPAGPSASSRLGRAGTVSLEGVQRGAGDGAISAGSSVGCLSADEVRQGGPSRPNGRGSSLAASGYLLSSDSTMASFWLTQKLHVE
mmetsp:Transcript_48983/g.122767  ORF Transcript_48983/g.122767 Transcript_48983/m.122767 type:complete len:230 (-) Transcript_48983:452-1141(-)